MLGIEILLLVGIYYFTETQIIEKFEAEQQNDPAMQQAGWQAILDNFKNYVESFKD